MLLEGHKRRQEDQLYALAWAVAHMLNIEGKTLKSHVTPEDLLGLPPRRRPKAPVEQRRAEYEELLTAYRKRQERERR